MNIYKLKLTIELFVIFILTIFIYLLASHYDILEIIVAFTRQHENWQLDEIITVSMFLVFVLLAFSYRRWKEVLVSEARLKLRNTELQVAFKEIKRLRGIVPICASCKKIRDDSGFWHEVESYIHEHSEAEFSHAICPDCMKKLYPDIIKDKMMQNDKPN